MATDETWSSWWVLLLGQVAVSLLRSFHRSIRVSTVSTCEPTAYFCLSLPTFSWLKLFHWGVEITGLPFYIDGLDELFGHRRTLMMLIQPVTDSFFTSDRISTQVMTSRIRQRVEPERQLREIKCAIRAAFIQFPWVDRESSVTYGLIKIMMTGWSWLTFRFEC